jgi:hypothetical protein
MLYRFLLVLYRHAILKISVADPDPHHLAGSGILEADPDPRQQNWNLINLFSVEKYCEKNLNTSILTFQLINKSYRPFQSKNISLQNFI